jgi:probable rRNA maturation factor
MPVSVTNEQSRRVRTALMRQMARRLLLEARARNARVDILLIDDTAMRSLNLEYRGFDKSTDVLSFAQRESVAGAPPRPQSPGMPEMLGDVVISVDTAWRQAREHEVALEQEMALLAVHGILHLLGFEDETEAGARAMHARERELLGFTFPSAALPA